MQEKIPTGKPTPDLATEPTKYININQKCKKSIANKKDINDEIFRIYFKCQILSCLTKDLLQVTLAKNEQLVNNVKMDWLILKNLLLEKKLLKMKMQTK